MVALAALAGMLGGCATTDARLATFVEQRAECDHWRGEEPYDAARAAEIARRAEQACRGTDAALADLKRRYADDARVREQLDAYETPVEPPADPPEGARTP